MRVVSPLSLIVFYPGCLSLSAKGMSLFDVAVKERTMKHLRQQASTLSCFGKIVSVIAGEPSEQDFLRFQNES